MKKFIALCIAMMAVTSIYTSIAFADDCAVGRTPEGVYPMSNEDIIMENEDIKIYPYEGRTECTFEFLNTGKEKDILMGFPCKQIPDPDSTDGNKQISDFTAWDNETKLNVIEDKAVKPPKSFDSRFNEYSSWFTFKVHFKEGERKVIKNTYKFSLTYYSTGDLLTGYIIKTGSVWKDKIGNATVTFYMSGIKPYYIGNFRGGPYFRFEQDKIIWERSNFEPLEDLEIYFTKYDELINQAEGEYKDGLIKIQKSLIDEQNKIEKMGKDELIKALDFDNDLRDGLRLLAYEKLLKLDPLYGQRIFMKINKARATINGITEDITNMEPKIYKNSTFIPLRFIVDNMGGEIKWDGKLKEITIDYNQKKIIMRIDHKDYLLNNKKNFMDAAPMIVNNRTLVPLRFISESMGYDVKWFEKDKGILISYKKDISQLGFELMENESIGKLKAGLNSTELVKGL